MTRVASIGCLAALLMLGGAASAFADDIGRDLRDIKRDRADIHRDRARLREERAERSYALRREIQAVEHGNLRAAERWDARRREEQRDVNAARRDLHRDRIDLARDRANLWRNIRREGY